MPDNDTLPEQKRELDARSNNEVNGSIDTTAEPNTAEEITDGSPPSSNSDINKNDNNNATTKAA